MPPELMQPTLPRVFVVRADGGRLTEAFRTGSYVAIGWLDLPVESLTSREAIRQEYVPRYPKQSPITHGGNVGQIHRFLNEIKPGSVVLTPFGNGNPDVLVGVVTGAPYRASGEEYALRLPVAWNAKPINRRSLRTQVRNTLGSLLTVFEPTQVSDLFEAAGFLLPSTFVAPISASNEVRIDAREQVRKALYALDAEAFNLLVGYVLRTLGFDASQSVGHTGDGGIDFDGELNVSGVASIRLQVQVKRITGKVNETAIREFRGALHNGAQGCFVTLSSFATRALESAQDPRWSRVNLIDGLQFVDLMTQQFDDLMVLLRQEQQTDLMAALPFERVLLPTS